MPQREEAHVGDHVPEAVQEEQNAHQEKQVVVAGEHVLRPEIHERPDGGTYVRQEETLVALCHAVGR